DPLECAPFLLALMGHKDGLEAVATLTPEAIRQRTFETLLAMCQVGSHRRPILFILEDLHWIDRVSEEFFSVLVERLQGAAIALLATYRPGYQAPWMQVSYSTQLTLPRLTPSESLTVVTSVIGDVDVDQAVVETVVEKAEGNPFFLEELARALRDGPRGQDVVPETVQDVLVARLDRLPETSRQVLQVGSVLGREFPRHLLEAVWTGPGRLEPHLAELRRLEFIQETLDGAGQVFAFKHALTQDVAYQSLLARRRRQLHEAAGRAYEALYEDRLEEVYDRLAHHYAQTDRSDKAVTYLSHFADAAVRGYAHREAAAALRQAISHAENLPPDVRERRAVELTTRLVHSLYFLGAFRESIEVLRTVESSVERLDDPLISGRYHF